jgi:hypothetical protein
MIKKLEATPERDSLLLTNFEKNFTKPITQLGFYLKGCQMVTLATYGNITKSSSNPDSE